MYNKNSKEHIFSVAITNDEDFIRQLITERAQLVANNDQLVAEHAQLVANNDQLVAEHAQLVVDNDRLMTENAKLKKIKEEGRIVIDQLTNLEAFLKEEIQQASSEVANLKGLTPKIPS
jgi:cell division protein FtsL